MNFEPKYLVRWGIPGWVFIILVGTILIYFELDLIKSSNIGLEKIIGLIVSFGFFGVPLGYLMHQVYFSFNWSSKEKFLWIIKRKRVIDTAIDLVEKKEEIINSDWGKNYHNDYYHFEYIWQRELLNLKEDERNYISERYRHLLSTIHSLGALRVSLLSSFFIDSVLVYMKWEETTQVPEWIILFILSILFLSIATFKGFSYYSNNLSYFQGYFLNQFLNKSK